MQTNLLDEQLSNPLTAASSIQSYNLQKDSSALSFWKANEKITPEVNRHPSVFENS